MKLLYIKLKNNIIPIAIFIFTICLILFSSSNIVSVKNSLNIWINNVIPSLFPFFIATELLNHTNIPVYIGKLFNKIMRPLFNVPGIGAYALFMGVISGYPVGAKIVTNLKNNNLCSKEEAERLITFTNNSGPLFILGTVGISIFNNIKIGILLLTSHIIASITVGILFRFWKNNKRSTSASDNVPSSISFASLGEVMSQSIFSAINSITMIGGFIILFGIILSILNQLHFFQLIYSFLSPVFNIFNISTISILPITSGIIEVTNGISLLPNLIFNNLNKSILVCSFLLGFGGISIILQVLSIISKSDISIKPYIIGKLLHGILSVIYTFIFINF